MKAALFTGKHELVVQDVEIPQITENQALIKLAACGVCHTDEGYIEGTPTFKNPPLILGHEPSGLIEEIGSNVQNVLRGDRVLIPPVLTCGTCKFCKSGRETICLNQKMLGNHIDGAFAEYIAVETKDLIKIPQSLPLKDTAIVSDALGTPYHAVIERAQVQQGDKVVIIGCGGIGINVVQFAAYAGAEVIAVDLEPSKLELASKLGAHHVINPNDEDVRKNVREIFGRADVAFEVIGNPKTQELAFSTLGQGGKMMVVGYSPKKWDTFNSGKVMFWEMDVMGSLGCPPRSFEKVLSLIEEGKITLDGLITHRYSLDRINDAFEQLRKGDGLRILIEF